MSPVALWAIPSFKGFSARRDREDPDASRPVPCPELVEGTRSGPQRAHTFPLSLASTLAPYRPGWAQLSPQFALDARSPCAGYFTHAGGQWRDAHGAAERRIVAPPL